MGCATVHPLSMLPQGSSCGAEREAEVRESQKPALHLGFHEEGKRVFPLSGHVALPCLCAWNLDEKERESIY